MSKKLLNESTIRRFAGLAGIKPTIVSNFIQESEYLNNEVVAEEDELDVDAEEDMSDELEDIADDSADAEGDMEDAIEDAADAEEEMADAALDAEEEAEMESEDTAEAIVQGIVDSLQQLAALAGVDMDVETPEDEDIVDMSVMDDDGEIDMTMSAEETLEEILDGILGEEEELEEEQKYGGNKGNIPKADRTKKGHHGKGMKRGETAREEGEEDYASNRDDKNMYESREDLVQEVLKRVKARLTQLSQAQE